MEMCVYAVIIGLALAGMSKRQRKFWLLGVIVAGVIAAALLVR